MQRAGGRQKAMNEGFHVGVLEGRCRHADDSAGQDEGLQYEAGDKRVTSAKPL